MAISEQECAGFGERAKSFLRKKLIGNASISSEGTLLYTSHIRAGRLRGKQLTLDSAHGLRYMLGIYEPEVTRSMRRFVHKGDTTIDVGAHIGFHSMYLGELVGQQGVVFSFEPSPANRHILEKNLQDNSIPNVTVFPYAISDEVSKSGKLGLHTSSYENFLIHDGDTNCIPSVDVPVTTIDQFLASQQVRQPSFIKVDVEGEEKAVLAGAAHTLEAHRPAVVAEVRDAYIEDVQLFMKDVGYSGKILSKPGSVHCQRGTPNYLFVPKMA